MTIDIDHRQSHITHIFSTIALLLFIIVNSTMNIASAATGLVYPDVYKDYIKFLNNRSPYKLTDFSGAHSRRDVVEIVLFLQALQMGGYHQPLMIETFIIQYRRALIQISNGKNDTLLGSVWLSDVSSKTDSFYISDIVIPKRKFIAGFYTLKHRVNEINIQKTEDIEQYKAICNPSWTVDYILLKELNANCINASRWEFMIKMLGAERGDFLLAPFQPTEDMILNTHGISLAPIKNIKTNLLDDRVFIVSKKTKNGKELFAALQRGIKILKSKKLFTKAYTESGFYNNKVKKWRMLEPISKSLVDY